MRDQATDPSSASDAVRAMAGAADIRIGTAGWSIRRAAAARFDSGGTHLERYSRQLDCAEINSSFHRPHATATYAKWRDSTPPAFRFAVKMPRAITHDLKLCKMLNDARRSSPSAISSPSMTDSFGNFAKPFITAESDAEVVVVSRAQEDFAAGLECDRPVAVQFQLAFPSVAASGRLSVRNSSIGSIKRPLAFAGITASLAHRRAPELHRGTAGAQWRKRRRRGPWVGRRLPGVSSSTPEQTSDSSDAAPQGSSRSLMTSAVALGRPPQESQGEG